MAKRIVTIDATLNKAERITVRLTPYLSHGLRVISQATGNERSVIVRAAIQNLVDVYMGKR